MDMQTNTATTRKCEHCRHYWPITHINGQCRRYAPRPGYFRNDADGDAEYPNWAQVQTDEFCGEFQEQEQEVSP